MDPIHTEVINCPVAARERNRSDDLDDLDNRACEEIDASFKVCRAREGVVAREILICDIILHPFSVAFFRENVIDEQLTDRFRDGFPSGEISLRTRKRAKLYVYARRFTMTN